MAVPAMFAHPVFPRLAQTNRYHPLYEITDEYQPEIHSLCSYCNGYCLKGQAGAHAIRCQARLEYTAQLDLDHGQRCSHGYHGKKGKAYSSPVRYGKKGKGEIRHHELSHAGLHWTKDGHPRDTLPPTLYSHEDGTGSSAHSDISSLHGPNTAAAAYATAQAHAQEQSSSSRHTAQFPPVQTSMETVHSRSGLNGNANAFNPLHGAHSPPLRTGHELSPPLRAGPRGPRGPHGASSHPTGLLEGNGQWDGNGDWDDDGPVQAAHNQPPPYQPWALTIQVPPFEEKYDGLMLPNWRGKIYFEDDQLRERVPYEPLIDVDEPKSARDLKGSIQWPAVAKYKDFRSWCSTYVALLRTLFKNPGNKLVPQWWSQLHIPDLLSYQTTEDQKRLASNFINTKPGYEMSLSVSNFLLSVCLHWPTKLKSNYLDIHAYIAAYVKPGLHLMSSLSQLVRVAQDAGVEIILEDPLHACMFAQKIGVPDIVLDECRRLKPLTYHPSLEEIKKAIVNIECARSQRHTKQPDLLTVAPAVPMISVDKKAEDLVSYHVQIGPEANFVEMDAFVTDLTKDILDIKEPLIQSCILNLRTVGSYQWNPRRKNDTSNEDKRPGFPNPANRSTFRSVRENFRRNPKGGRKKGKGKKGSKGKRGRKGLQARIVDIDDRTEEEEYEGYEDEEEWFYDLYDSHDEPDESISAQQVDLAYDPCCIETYYTFLAMAQRCFACGKPGHRSNECTAPEQLCWSCGQTGHTRSECTVPEAERVKYDQKMRASLKQAKAMIAHIETHIDTEEDEVDKELVDF